MSEVANIGVPTQLGAAPAADSQGLGAGVAAVAYEIAHLLERLVAHGECGAIDLRSLPMTIADRLRLQEFLGSGEVRAEISADGPSVVRETAIPGVWWSEHRNAHAELIAEVIEVCPVPEILVLSKEELATGSSSLRERIATLRAAHES